ncbi:MAG: RNA polymerase sigma-70 factor [Prevotellaceae bacterium]|jgi:RNA polymerase sigma-70 factor (ECF subfamily)|nr:RNA polymerase sigma-70 factor [Prevotellaceae bacterium]
MTFEDLYIRYYARLNRFAKVYVADDSEAENIVQDVFTFVWEHFQSVAAHPKPEAYLLLAVKNRCIDLLRRQLLTAKVAGHLQREYEQTRHLSLQALTLYDAGEEERDADGQMLARAIDALPPRCREIFIKKKIEGKRQADIAVELNISVKTVEAQMQIAYRQLREALK